MKKDNQSNGIQIKELEIIKGEIVNNGKPNQHMKIFREKSIFEKFCIKQTVYPDQSIVSVKVRKKNIDSPKLEILAEYKLDDIEYDYSTLLFCPNTIDTVVNFFLKIFEIEKFTPEAKEFIFLNFVKVSSDYYKKYVKVTYGLEEFYKNNEMDKLKEQFSLCEKSGNFKDTWNFLYSYKNKFNENSQIDHYFELLQMISEESPYFEAANQEAYNIYLSTCPEIDKKGKDLEEVYKRLLFFACNSKNQSIIDQSFNTFCGYKGVKPIIKGAGSDYKVLLNIAVFIRNQNKTIAAKKNALVDKEKMLEQQKAINNDQVNRIKELEKKIEILEQKTSSVSNNNKQETTNVSKKGITIFEKEIKSEANNNAQNNRTLKKQKTEKSHSLR